jgi:hypothetical protein
MQGDQLPIKFCAALVPPVPFCAASLRPVMTSCVALIGCPRRLTHRTRPAEVTYLSNSPLTRSGSPCGPRM